jgi:bifunctional non-homologous end joining protein LigD
MAIAYTPMLLTEPRRGTAPPVGENWGMELKFNGFRMLAQTAFEGTVTLQTRQGNDYTDRVPAVAAQLPLALSNHSAVVDGEMVGFDESKHESLAVLQRRRPWPVRYFIFDLLELDGTPLVNVPLRDRRDRLEAIYEPQPDIALSPLYTDARKIIELIKGARERGLEGVVAKHLDSRYYPGRRSPDWVKYRFVKHRRGAKRN